MQNGNNNKPRGMFIFSVIWFGQLISTFGSGLTGFALGVWLYETTGPRAPFYANGAILALCTLVLWALLEVPARADDRALA